MKAAHAAVLNELRVKQLSVPQVEALLRNKVVANEVIGQLVGLELVELLEGHMVEITLKGIDEIAAYRKPQPTPPRRINPLEGDHVPLVPNHRNDGNKHIKSRGF